MAEVRAVKWERGRSTGSVPQPRRAAASAASASPHQRHRLPPRLQRRRWRLRRRRGVQRCRGVQHHPMRLVGQGRQRQVRRLRLCCCGRLPGLHCCQPLRRGCRPCRRPCRRHPWPGLHGGWRHCCCCCSGRRPALQLAPPAMQQGRVPRQEGQCESRPASLAASPPQHSPAAPGAHLRSLRRSSEWRQQRRPPSNRASGWPWQQRWQ